MRNYAKVGARPGRPAYRTPALFRYRKYVETVKSKIRRTKNSHKQSASKRKFGRNHNMRNYGYI